MTDRLYFIKKGDASYAKLQAIHYIKSKYLIWKPTIKDTRISVEQILDELSGGITIQQLVAEYPRLSYEAVYAALAFAADTLRSEVVYPLDQAAS